MKEDKNIDELFREKLQNYEQGPPAHILENILAGTPVTVRRKKLIFLRIAAVAAALLLAFVAGWQFNARDRQVLKQEIVASRNAENEAGTKNLPQSKTSVGAFSETFNQKENTINSNSSTIPNSARIASKPESTRIALNAESISLTPIKSRSVLIKTNTNSAMQLQERKTNEDPEKSIDQQIMEQNQKILLAQNIEKEKGHWLVGAQISPVRSVSSGSQSQQYASNMLNKEASNPVDLGAGLTVEYKPGKRWSLQSGVYYSGLAQTSANSSYSSSSKNSIAAGNSADFLNTKVNVDAKTNKISMNSSAGVIEFKGVPSQLVIGNSIESSSLASAVFVSETQFTQSFEYIEIPLYLRYALLDKRFGIEMVGGFSSNLLVGNHAYMENSSGKILIGDTKDMETMNYSGTLGIGFKYELLKQFYLNLEPRVKYYLNSLNSNESVTYKPYTIGVFTGLSYQF